MRCRKVLAGLAATLIPVHTVSGQPDELFGPETIVVGRVDLTRFTPARVQQATSNVLPDDDALAETNAALLAQIESADGILQPLRDLGIDTLHVVGISLGGWDAEFVWAVSLPGPAEHLDGQADRVRQIATDGGRQATRLGGWMVAHTSDLPGAGTPAVIDDAPFLEALSGAPDRDAVFALAPSPAWRTQFREAFDDWVASEPAEDGPTLRSLRPVTEARWYRLAIGLGASPSIELCCEMGTVARANSLRSATGTWRTALTGRIRESHDEQMRIYRKALAEYRRRAQRDELTFLDSEPEKPADPQPVIDMVNVLGTQQRGTQLVLHLDRGELRKIVDGMLVMAEKIAQALFSGSGEEGGDDR